MNSTFEQNANGGDTWPTTGLDVGALRRKGWQPQPFAEFVLKIHSRCNLACDYCYMYELADQSWRNQPNTMSEQVFADACATIGEHAERFALPAVHLIFHGGEPLMVGHRKLAAYAEHARTALSSKTDVRLGVQTNGVLLDEEFLGICDKWQIPVGVSIDGDRRGHDRHRKYRRGTGSYDDVARGIGLLNRDSHRHLYAGLLATIDVDNDPIETYEALVEFQPPNIDLMLPHGNWACPPPHKDDPDATPYADWLIPIFDRWYDAPTLETHVRFFDDVIELLLGGNRSSEALGVSATRLAVIETDGTIEQVDALKSAFEGATKLHTPTSGNPLDQALWEPSVIARQIGIEALSDTCRACPVHTICGGGHYAHRYREDTGFRSPSVYCADLKKVIAHVDARLRADILATHDTTIGDAYANHLTT